ncbi:hypothetical protein V8J36_21835 [Frigidibacter sp. MR17.14]|uniref:hypothetical protein n=1 Tax=Frigidibacter sp. MR17.14 TaxID=3126509 RepID=UPI003012EE2E
MFDDFRSPRRAPWLMLTLAAFTVASGVSLHRSPVTGGWALGIATAQAKGGSDDGGGDDHGGEAGDDHDDDSGEDAGDDSSHGSGGSADHASDDASDDAAEDAAEDAADDHGTSGGADDGATHDLGDDHGGRSGRDGGGHRRGGTETRGDSRTGDVARVERSAAGIEVTYADGWREELEGGRYELKDARNRTVIERTATAADIERLRRLAR